MNIPDLCNNRSHLRENYIKKNFPEFFEFIQNTYKDTACFQEKLYLYANKCEPHKCPICGKRTKFINFEKGYNKFCAYKCASLGSRYDAKQTCLQRYGDENYRNIEKSKQTCLEKYGKEYYTQTDECVKKTKSSKLKRYGNENYNNKEKSKQTCLEKYGKEYYTQTDEYNIESRSSKLEKYGDETYNNRPKAKQTCMVKYEDETYNNRPKAKQTCMEHYGVDNYFKSEHLKQYLKEHHDEIQEKAYNTKKSNNSFNKSTIEDQFKQYLEDNNINYIYQYRSDLYPFNCDFYFPGKDMYLEINGFWHHGKHPFDPIKDETELNRWKELSKTSKSYKNAIETWTIRDPKKVQIAKDNNINLKVFYGCQIDELMKFCKENIII